MEIKEICELNHIEGIPWEIDFALSAFKIGKFNKVQAIQHIGVIINDFSGLEPNDNRGLNAAQSFVEFVEMNNENRVTELV